MTKYLLTHPDGRKIEIDSPTPPTEELAQQVFKAASGATQKTPEMPVRPKLQPLTEEQKAQPQGVKASDIAKAAFQGWNEGIENLANRMASGMTFGGTDWLDRHTPGSPQAALREQIQARADAEGLGTLNKAGEFAADVYGNIKGAGGKLAAGIAKTGAKGLKALALNLGLGGAAYGTTASDRLADVPNNALASAVLSELFGFGTLGAGKGGTWLYNTARPYANAVENAVDNAVERVGLGKLKDLAQSALNKGRNVLEVGDDEILRLTQEARQQSPEAYQNIAKAQEAFFDTQNARNSAAVNDAFGSKGKYENIDDIIKLAREQAEPYYDKLREIGDLAQIERNLRLAGTSVIDEAGNPLKVFHGSRVSGLDIIDASKGQSMTKSDKVGNFFSNRKDTAQSYGDNVYEAYLNMKNPLVVDYNGKFYNDPVMVDGVTMGKNTGFSDTSVPSITDVAKYAKGKGYDGVVAQNIKDWGDTSQVFGKPDTNRIKELKNLGDDVLYAKMQEISPSSETSQSFFKRMGKRNGRDYLAKVIEQTERQGRTNLIADDYIVFNPEQVVLEGQQTPLQKVIADSPYLQQEIAKVKNTPLYQTEYQMAKLPDTDWRVLDQVNRNINQDIGALERNVGKSASTNDVRLLEMNKYKLLNAVDDIVPEYKLARGIYEAEGKALRAQKIGEEALFDNNTSAEKLARTMQDMTDYEKASLKVGAREKLKNVLESRENEALGWKKINNEQTKGKLKLVLGDKADNVINYADDETQAMRNYNNTTGGSQTSSNEQMRDMPQKIGLLKRISSNPTGAIGEIIKAGDERINNASKDVLTQLLLEQGGGRLNNALEDYLVRATRAEQLKSLLAPVATVGANRALQIK